MQLDWQAAYAFVSASVPFPCGHCPAHSVVALTWPASGHGTPTHAAWQQMSALSPVRVSIALTYTAPSVAYRHRGMSAEGSKTQLWMWRSVQKR